MLVCLTSTSPSATMSSDILTLSPPKKIKHHYYKYKNNINNYKQYTHLVFQLTSKQINKFLKTFSMKTLFYSTIILKDLLQNEDALKRRTLTTNELPSRHECMFRPNNTFFIHISKGCSQRKISLD